MNSDLSWHDTLGLQGHSCVSLIGAGGKTTTMLSIAAEAAVAGKRAVVTTTTKVWPPAGMPTVLSSAGARWMEDLITVVQASGHAALGERVGHDGKLHGVAPDSACQVAGLAEVDVLICEADGAAGRPLKVHGPGEPVVPPCTTHLLICVGVDALGGCSEAAVHRLPEFSRRYGDAVVSIEIVAEILADLLRFTPPGARAFFLVNKIDDRAALRRAEPLVTRLAQLRPGVPAVLACRGRVRAYPTRAAVAPPR